MMLRKRSSRWAAAKTLLLLPLVCIALGAFARTDYVVADDKGTQSSENSQGFSGCMGVRSDGEGRMLFELEGTGDAMLGAQGLMSWFSLIDLGEDSFGNAYVRELMAMSFDRDKNDVRLIRPLVLVDGRRIAATAVPPAGDRIARIVVLDSEAAQKAYGKEGDNGAIEITTKKAGAPNSVVQRALEDDASSQDMYWFTGTSLQGTEEGGLSMGGSFGKKPMTKEQMEQRFAEDIMREMDEVPVDRQFNGMLAFRMDGDDRAVATVYGYGDALMAASSLTFRSEGQPAPPEEQFLGEMLYRLSRTAAASAYWMALPMPYILVDGQPVRSVDEVPDAGRIVRIEALGAVSAQKMYGKVGADGAVLITTKSEDASTMNEVMAEKQKGARFMSACSEDNEPKKGEGGFYSTRTMRMTDIEQEAVNGACTTAENTMQEFAAANDAIEPAAVETVSVSAASIAQRDAVAAGPALAGEPERESRLKPAHSDYFSGKMTLRVTDGDRAVAFLSGDGDGLTAVASQLTQNHRPLSRIAYRVSRTASHDVMWNAQPMPYVLVDGRRIATAKQVPDAEQIRSVEVLGKRTAVARYGEAGKEGAVLIHSKKRSASTKHEIALERANGAKLMSAGRMSHEMTWVPTGVVDVANQTLDGAGRQGNPTQIVLATSTGEPVMVMAACKMELSDRTEGVDLVQDITMDIDGNTVRTTVIDTLQDQRAEQVVNMRTGNSESERLGSENEMQGVRSGADYSVRFMNASTKCDWDTGIVRVKDTGYGFAIKLGSGYRDVGVYVNGERMDASYLNDMDPSAIKYLKLLRTDEQLAPYGEVAADGKIRVEIVLKRGRKA